MNSVLQILSSIAPPEPLKDLREHLFFRVAEEGDITELAATDRGWTLKIEVENPDHGGWLMREVARYLRSLGCQSGIEFLFQSRRIPIEKLPSHAVR
jgi:hypothetical protein